MNSFSDTERDLTMKRTQRYLLEKLTHASDCAKHNPPAYPAGACDCGLILSIHELHQIVHNNYDADPLDCAMGTAEEVAAKQLTRIIELLNS